jgi:hypothetical protein
LFAIKIATFLLISEHFVNDAARYFCCEFLSHFCYEHILYLLKNLFHLQNRGNDKFLIIMWVLSKNKRAVNHLYTLQAFCYNSGINKETLYKKQSIRGSQGILPSALDSSVRQTESR